MKAIDILKGKVIIDPKGNKFVIENFSEFAGGNTVLLKRGSPPDGLGLIMNASGLLECEIENDPELTIIMKILIGDLKNG